MEEKPILTKESLLKGARRRVELSTGEAVIIRKITPATITKITSSLPDLSALAVKKGEDSVLAGASPDQVYKSAVMIDAVVVAGVVKPSLVMDPGEDDIGPGDFGHEDRMMLFEEILGFSGFSRKEAKEVLPFSRTSG